MSKQGERDVNFLNGSGINLQVYVLCPGWFLLFIVSYCKKKNLIKLVH